LYNRRKYGFAFAERDCFLVFGLQWRPNFRKLLTIETFHIKPIHDRMTAFLEPRDYPEYLESAERPPLHLLRILPAEEMRAKLVETSDITSKQVSLFDSQ
jgi:putative SOS response-associated peptidase YedK